MPKFRSATALTTVLLAISSCSSQGTDETQTELPQHEAAVPIQHHGGAQSSRILLEDVKRLDPAFKPKGGPWNFKKLTHQDNHISRHYQSDGSKLVAYAIPSGEIVSKASANFTSFDADRGSTLHLSFCMYADEYTDLSDVFIADLECVFCWPDTAPVPNHSPGIRIHLKDFAGYPVIERAKIGLGRNSLRPATQLREGIPRNQWVPIEWRIRIGDDDQQGWTQLLVDNEVILEQFAQTIFNEGAFAGDGVRPTSHHYDSLELGITANASDAPVELKFKNVLFSELDNVTSPSAPVNCQ